MYNWSRNYKKLVKHFLNKTQAIVRIGNDYSMIHYGSTGGGIFVKCGQTSWSHPMIEQTDVNDIYRIINCLREMKIEWLDPEANGEKDLLDDPVYVLGFFRNGDYAVVHQKDHHELHYGAIVKIDREEQNEVIGTMVIVRFYNGHYRINPLFLNKIIIKDNEIVDILGNGFQTNDEMLKL